MNKNTKCKLIAQIRINNIVINLWKAPSGLAYQTIINLKDEN